MFALSYFGLVPPKRGSSGTHTHTQPHTHYMSPQTSSPNVTFMSVALLIASFSIVIYHHITYQMVYGDGSGDDALLLRTGYTATLGRGVEQSLVTERPRYGGEDSTQKNKGVAASSVGLFSVVMLSYRSPKSLQHTLRSLCRAKVHEHPLFSEFVVYFQVFEAEEDTKLVQDVLREPVCGKEFSRFRVIGHKSNFPVASATPYVPSGTPQRNTSFT
ncbi:transmembrane protein, putative [Bodo saltans]|uniref:Transmembrane protein, putative n=1 Tax=Bodo saltans TaxID=75058 RepID=A0A0S4ITX3_BODSA|nr:transmembrane protein, putative [Bodo saltans]|eukprot:CUF91823.1 transmembrane protein, putative [Bodo saltans]